MRRTLAGSTIVVTGASSGVGRAAALRFAAEGARVVVVARRGDALERLAGEIKSRGGAPLTAPADVADFDAVQEVARRAASTFGGIDVWVNNAGVVMFARFEDAPLDLHRRVVETNYFGTVHGARAAIPYMRDQGHGIIINNSSVLGEAGAPYLSAYVATKWAIRALGESLRMELRGTGVKVATLMPGSIDTPIFHHAANYTGRAIKPLDPVLSVDRVACSIVSLARRPRREAIVGNAGRFLALQHRIAPALTELVMGALVRRRHFARTAAPPTPGTLLEPMPHHTSETGGWKRLPR